MEMRGSGGLRPVTITHRLRRRKNYGDSWIFKNILNVLKYRQVKSQHDEGSERIICHPVHDWAPKTA
jgi:hypothetical protein